jgi:A/G-specific adenine glycosylase
MQQVRIAGLHHLPAGGARHHTIVPMEELLLTWFRREARDLPWRRTRDPYAVLVSEVMLQQTQVERVVPRYERWLERWPTAESLAAASPAEVIVEWQGLGYNRRALALHRAARHVAADGWPVDLTTLPGIGPYTAAAVRNFAFGEDVLPRDVNVDRVERRTGHAFGPAAAQALMDLGATVCLARVPRCDVCPLAGECPSKGVREAPRRKQSRFEGSFRQRRAATLRRVVAHSVPARRLGRGVTVRGPGRSRDASRRTAEGRRRESAPTRPHRRRTGVSSDARRGRRRSRRAGRRRCRSSPARG